MEERTKEFGLSLAGTHANHLVQAESSSERKMTATSGQKCLESLEKQSPLWHFAKMFMVTSDWDWTMLSLTWKVKDTLAGYLLFRLLPQARPTEETGFMLWPTPQAMDAMVARSPEAMKRQMTTSRKGRTKIGTMKDAAVYGLLWTGEAIRKGEGELSPHYLEWMLNYPDGWTEIER